MSAEGVVAVAVMNRTAALQLITMAAQARYMVMAQHRLQAHRLLHRGKVHPAFTRAGRHWLSPADAEAILVRQLRRPHFNTCPGWSRRSSIALTAATSPNVLPQSSTGRFEVNSESPGGRRSEEHTSELQSQSNLV